MTENATGGTRPETETRGNRKGREGLVVSDKMDKTVVVQVEDHVHGAGQLLGDTLGQQRRAGGVDHPGHPHDHRVGERRMQAHLQNRGWSEVLVRGRYRPTTADRVRR